MFVRTSDPVGALLDNAFRFCVHLTRSEAFVRFEVLSFGFSLYVDPAWPMANLMLVTPFGFLDFVYERS